MVTNNARLGKQGNEMMNENDDCFFKRLSRFVGTAALVLLMAVPAYAALPEPPNDDPPIGDGGTCAMSSGPAADQIVDECMESIGYRRGDERSYTYGSVLQHGGGGYTVCHNAAIIEHQACSNGDAVWETQSPCNQSYPTCGAPTACTWTETGMTTCLYMDMARNDGHCSFHSSFAPGANSPNSGDVGVTCTYGNFSGDGQPFGSCGQDMAKTKTYTCVPPNGQPGACGNAHSTTPVASAPSSNLCGNGATANWTDQTASDGTYNWSCPGLNGGQAASCSVPKESAPPNECTPTCTEVQETRFKQCPSGQTGLIKEVRQVNVGGVCGVQGPWTQVECSCAATMVNNPVQVSWAAFANNNGSTMFEPGGRAKNNCPAGYTQTEVIDDNDSMHSLAEDSSDGRNHQLCIKTSDDNIKLTSTWAAGACPSGMIDTTLSDTYTSKTDRGEEKYMYRHDLAEEDEGSGYWHWCLGLTPESVAKGAKLSVRASGSAYCDANEALLVHWHDNERNFNDEDGSNNRALCVKVTSPSSTAPSVCTANPGCSEVTDTTNGTCPSGYTGTAILERRRNMNGICGNDETQWRMKEDNCVPEDNGGGGGGSGDPWDVDRGCFYRGTGATPECSS